MTAQPGEPRRRPDLDDPAQRVAYAADVWRRYQAGTGIRAIARADGMEPEVVRDLIDEMRPPVVRSEESLRLLDDLVARGIVEPATDRTWPRPTPIPEEWEGVSLSDIVIEGRGPR
jgi:hypothetical protein